MQLFTSIFLMNFACTGNTTSYSGHGTYDYLAFDGDRLWRYQSESADIDYTLVVEKAESTTSDGVETTTFIYSKEDPQEDLGSVTWVSGLIEGIGITQYTTASGEEVVFDSTVVFAQNRMIPGGSVVTETNGVVFTATMHGVEDCPNEWNTNEVWECLHFELSVDNNEQDFPFIGDFWNANGWGTSRFSTAFGPWAADSDWVLTFADCKYDGVDC